MNVSGIFPTECHNFGGAWIISHPSHNLVEGSSDSINSRLAAIANERLLQESNSFVTGKQPPWSLSPFYCVVSGKPVPTPPDQFRHVIQKWPTTNFREKVRNGVIVMNPFRKGGVWASYHLGMRDLEPPVPVQDFTKQYDAMPSLFEMESRGSEITIKQGPVDFVMNNSQFQVKAVRRNLSLGVSPYDVGWDDELLTTILGRCATGPDVGSSDIASMITNVAGEANMGTIDALTSLAELPEAVRYLIDTLRLFMRVFTDAKKKEFRLFNKRKRIQGLTKEEMSAVQQAKALKDIADAISDVWLQFRYAIMPMVYTIEDIVETNESLKKQFLRFRGRFVSSVPFNVELPTGWHCSKTTLSCTSRVLVKNSFSEGAQLSDLLGSNISVTAWELVPLSFVVDWFFNIGDFLASFRLSKPNWESKATFSWRIEDELTFVHEPTNARVSIVCKYYERTLINPSDYCRLVYNPNLNLVRQLDAFALIWKTMVR